MEKQRKIAIYARKSKITETGKSIQNQIDRCACYAKLKFDAQADRLLVYQDEGLSGFYSDRPQYINMLKEIRRGNVQAVICYKFDRISRRTLELLELVEELRRRDIAFISCTDEVDTGTKTGKIVMSLLASIAEFERDIIAERITDNLCALAKEGRWLGGTTPTGFRSVKKYIAAAGRRTAVNHLEPVKEEQETVRELFMQFLKVPSLQRTVEWAAKQGMRTKNGRLYTRASVKGILINPVYAAADADTLEYFTAKGALVYTGTENLNGTHGWMVYNKTRQLRLLREDSRQAGPSYVQKNNRREIKDWIIAVGEHKPLLEGKAWVAVQKYLEDNCAHQTRPAARSGALLVGKVVCACCGAKMLAHRESGRFTNGQPRFVYQCSKRRADKTACSGKQVNGNALDDAVWELVYQLCGAFEEKGEHALKDTLEKLAGGAAEKRGEIKKRVVSMQKELEEQARNLRQASDEVRPYLLEDMKRIAQQLEKIKANYKNLASEAMLYENPGKNLPFYACAELINCLVERVAVEHSEGGKTLHIFLKGNLHIS